MPFFSIIMPVYDREAYVERALQSCLRQSFGDFEVIVVDDGSADRSTEVVESVGDPRIRLLRHERNRGRCPARNTGMAAAGGEWFVFLDSDDELLAGALQTIHAEACAAPPEVVALRYMCVDDRGTKSPEPAYRGERWSYEDYVRALDSDVRGEALPCSRTSTFPGIAYPDGHAEEGLYHLDLARAGQVGTSPAVVRLYHQDASNQITAPSVRRALRFARDAARNVDETLARHGAALRRLAPATYAGRLREGALTHFLAGHRRRGLQYARMALAHGAGSAKLVLVVSLGLLGPLPLACSQAVQGLIRRRLVLPR